MYESCLPHSMPHLCIFGPIISWSSITIVNMCAVLALSLHFLFWETLWRSLPGYYHLFVTYSCKTCLPSEIISARIGLQPKSTRLTKCGVKPYGTMQKGTVHSNASQDQSTSFYFVSRNNIIFTHVMSRYNTADLVTKALVCSTHERALTLLQLSTRWGRVLFNT